MTKAAKMYSLGRMVILQLLEVVDGWLKPTQPLRPVTTRRVLTA
jgi:hypothetical protein